MLSKILDLYREAHLILLPYDSDIYYLRGSAVLMEALSYGRLVLTSTHTALSDQVAYYNSGLVCETVKDYTRGIKHFYDMSSKVIERQALQSAFRYARDCEFSYKGWFR